MAVLDITQVINSETPVFPGTPSPKLQVIKTLDQDGFLEHQLAFTTHTGTHVDLPGHLFENGKSIDMIDIQQFIGPALLIDCTKQKKIDRNFLEAHILWDIPFDFLILKTGASKNWGTENYLFDYPYIDPEAAFYLADMPIKGIGIDALSVDPVDSKDLPAHEQLLGSQKLIYENLTRLDQIEDKYFKFWGIPLKIACADAAPVRALAEIASS